MPPGTSVSKASAARLAADGSSAVLALLTGSIVARHLGAAAKGTVSTLSYLVALFATASALGLGEAAATMIGKRHSDPRQVAPATVGILLASLPLGAICLLGAAWTQFDHAWRDLRSPILVACVALAFTTLAAVLGLLMEAQQHLLLASIVRATMGFVTASATGLFVLVFGWSVTGAVGATALAALTGVVILAVLLLRHGVPLRPRWNAAYLRPALRLGVPIQVSLLLVVLAARVDLLLVRELAGSKATGYYSVALTMGQLSSYLAIALSAGSYPRLANLEEVHVLGFSALLGRTALAGSIVGGVVLAGVLPWLTPVAFGSGFRPAVQPALILLVSGVFGSLQWVLCRANAARGRPASLLLSYGCSLAVMVVLDVALIPPWGLAGAATASVASALIGLIVVLGSYRRAFGPDAALLRFAPRAADFMTVVSLPIRLAREVSGLRAHSAVDRPKP